MVLVPVGIFSSGVEFWARSNITAIYKFITVVCTKDYFSIICMVGGLFCFFSPPALISGGVRIQNIISYPRTNARMGKVDRNWTKSGGRPSPMARGFVSGWACASPTLPGKMTFWVSIFTEPDPQGTGRVDIHTHPYTTVACAAGVVTKTTDRDSLRYTYDGTRRVCQLALGCESSWVKSTHNAYENTWKCGELKLYFSPSAGG